MSTIKSPTGMKLMTIESQCILNSITEQTVHLSHQQRAELASLARRFRTPLLKRAVFHLLNTK